MLISPVVLIVKSIINYLTQNGQTNLVSNSRYNLVNATLSKMNVVLSLFLIITSNCTVFEPFLGF
jgi:hypothetical protein